MRGVVIMVSRSDHSYQKLYKFRNGYIDGYGLFAEYQYCGDIFRLRFFQSTCVHNEWVSDGYFSLENGKSEWVISEIQFVVD